MDNFVRFVFTHFPFRCVNILFKQSAGFLILIIILSYVLFLEVLFGSFSNMPTWFLIPLLRVQFVLLFHYLHQA